MFSHGCAGGEGGKVEHGQASPIERPSTWVRDGGQMGVSPSIRTVHKVVIGTMGTDEANVDG